MSKQIVFFLLGGLVGGLVVFLFTQQEVHEDTVEMVTQPSSHAEMTMDEMVLDLQGVTGDEFDRRFLEGMIVHHIGAIEMAKLATASAGHIEIREMAQDILEVQSAEVQQMRSWQAEWGYRDEHTGHE